MLLSEEKLQARLDSPNNLANKFSSSSRTSLPVEIKPPYVARRVSKSEAALNPEARVEIKTRALAGEKQVELAKEFGVSPNRVTDVMNGNVETDEEKVKSNLDLIRDVALERLLATMGFLTDDKLSGCSAVHLSTIASNMSKIVEKTQPKSSGEEGVKVIIFAPETRPESKYQTIEVKS